MRTGPDFRDERVLADGARIEIRHIRPDDAEELRRGFAALSPASRYRRFFGGVSHLSDELVRYLTVCDGHDHVALVAVEVLPDLKTEHGVGIARFVRLADEPRVAEVAVTVVDGMQHKGIGHLLLTKLAEAARERGVERFRAEVLTSNEPIRHMLREVDAQVVRESPESITVDVPLSSTERPTERVLGSLLREAASSMAGLVRSLRPPSL